MNTDIDRARNVSVQQNKEDGEERTDAYSQRPSYREETQDQLEREDSTEEPNDLGHPRQAEVDIASGSKVKKVARIRAFLRCLLAEFLGTGILVYFHGGNAIAEAQGFITQEGRAIGNGLIIAALIYALGSISGGHFNSAITVALTLRLALPIWIAPFYLGIQFAGALAAGGLLRAWFGAQCVLGASNPALVNWSAMLMEALMTYVFVTVVLLVTLRGKLMGHHSALAVGFAFIVCTMFCGHYTSASLNPARSLGVGLVCGELQVVWVFVAGPFIGAAAAAVTVHIFFWHRTDVEKKVPHENIK